MASDNVQLGRIVATPGALQRAEDEGIDVTRLLARHAAGDWGDTHPEDKRANTAALASGERLVSWYGTGRTQLMIITEAATDACPACFGYGGVCEPDKGEWADGNHYRTDRPMQRLATTVLLPEDY